MDELCAGLAQSDCGTSRRSPSTNRTAILRHFVSGGMAGSASGKLQEWEVDEIVLKELFDLEAVRSSREAGRLLGKAGVRSCRTSTSATSPSPPQMAKGSTSYYGNSWQCL